jgi:putative transposase
MPKFTRKPNRLPHKPLYQGNNWYFVTICAVDKKCFFVEEPLRFQNRFQNNKLELNEIGKEIDSLWKDIPIIFSSTTIDEFVIMPNHIHGIIGISDDVYYKNGDKAQSLSDIIGKFKSLSWTNVKQNISSEIWNHKGSSTQIWQKSFYDHIIRDEKDLERVREYICNNPLQWELDEMNPRNNINDQKINGDTNGHGRNVDTVVADTQIKQS